MRTAVFGEVIKWKRHAGWSTENLIATTSRRQRRQFTSFAVYRALGKKYVHIFHKANGTLQRKLRHVDRSVV